VTGVRGAGWDGDNCVGERGWGGDGDSYSGNGVGMGTVSVGMGIKFQKLWGWGGDGDNNHGNGRGWGQNLSPCSSLLLTNAPKLKN